jgi:hypothetical protein
MFRPLYVYTHSKQVLLCPPSVMFLICEGYRQQDDSGSSLCYYHWCIDRLYLWNKEKDSFLGGLFAKLDK